MNENQALDQEASKVQIGLPITADLQTLPIAVQIDGSFGQGRYGSPVWSPKGDLIAFTRINGGRFSIGVMSPDGSGERTVAEGYDVEEPSWAPNGRVLVFFRKEPVDAGGGGGRSRLFSVDVMGRNEREIPTPGDASDPAWSPVNP